MHYSLEREGMDEMMRVKSCPKCGNEMDTIDKSATDHLLAFLSFKILQVKRYLCLGCFWECRELKTN